MIAVVSFLLPGINSGKGVILSNKHFVLTGNWEIHDRMVLQLPIYMILGNCETY